MLRSTRAAATSASGFCLVIEKDRLRHRTGQLHATVGAALAALTERPAQVRRLTLATLTVLVNMRLPHSDYLNRIAAHTQTNTNNVISPRRVKHTPYMF